MGDVQDVVRDTQRPKLHFVRLCINGNRMEGRVNGQSGERWAMGDNTPRYHGAVPTVHVGTLVRALNGMD
jgi:hypothetical protein